MLHWKPMPVLAALCLTFALPAIAQTKPEAVKTPPKPLAKPAETGKPASKPADTSKKAEAHAAPANANPPVAKAAPHVEFLRDIAPILDRSGCSTAECHGKFGGRGGLQLSLLTLSPEDDYEPLVHGGRGRRVNFADPEKSLLLLKATGAVPHAGGKRFETDSPAYKTFLRWLKQGAPFDEKDPRLVTLVISPEKVAFKKVGDTQVLKATATYTDGSVRDVTKQTVFLTSNASVIPVTSAGVVTGARWGGGAIMGRYLGTISASFFTLPQTRKGVYPTIAADNVIDKLVLENLKRLNVVPSPLSTDAEFLRRVTLDTLGRLPTAEEINAFTADKAADKRAKMIDSLLDKPEFADLRALRLSDLLRVNPNGNRLGQLGDRAAVLFYEWIWKSVVANKPWDQFARELVTAKGSNYQYGPANFYRIEYEPNNRMENIGQAFLGVRMSCARCHKHPFDRWNTDDYWNFAAFTGKMSVGGGRLYGENVIYYNHGAQVVNQSVTGRNRGKVAPPTFLGEKTPAKEQPDMIVGLADWMTDPKNPFFARAAVNRLWSYYFGKGIINPVDDMRATIPESVPGLINALAEELVKSKYDMKHVIRLVLNSRTYQTTSVPNESNVKDDRFFSRYMPRPMPAQVLLDMLDQATGVREQFTNYPERSRAVQTAYPVGNYFLDAFGQSHREFLADIDPKLEPNLVQTLHMINSGYIDNKVRNGTTVDAVLKESKTDEETIRALYLRTLCRPPTSGEIVKAADLMKEAKDKKEGAQDLLWALITAREFYFNH